MCVKTFYEKITKRKEQMLTSTIKDVAALAGTSISTVSRVTHNAPNVNAEVRERVLDAIKKLNYKPNMIAQGLGGQGFNCIGVVSTRATQVAFTNPYYTTVLQAIGEICADENCEIMLNGAASEQQEYDKCMMMVNSRVVRGFIFLSARTNSHIFQKLSEINFPFVVIGNVPDDILSDKVYSVDTDNYRDAQISTEYLIRNGHQHIGLLHSPLDYIVNRERLEGYINAHKINGIPVDHSLIMEAGYTHEQALPFAQQLLKNPLVSAIVATDDTKAYGIYKAAESLNKSIPNDCSVIGHNNYHISTIMSPPLTTVNVPIYDLGIVATKKLFGVMKNINTERRTLLDSEMIVRESCRKIG